MKTPTLISTLTCVCFHFTYRVQFQHNALFELLKYFQFAAIICLLLSRHINKYS